MRAARRGEQPGALAAVAEDEQPGEQRERRADRAGLVGRVVPREHAEQDEQRGPGQRDGRLRDALRPRDGGGQGGGEGRECEQRGYQLTS